MIVSVLCPGPSLEAYIPGDEMKIAVNRAALFCRCDWWAVSDYTFLKEHDCGYPIRLFTNRDTKINHPERFIEVLRKESVAVGFQHLSLVGLRRDTGFPLDFARVIVGDTRISWLDYTATSALILAAYLGATKVNVYGADMRGIQDWDGHEYQRPGEEAYRTRSPERWEREAAIWGGVVKSLGDREVSIKRVRWESLTT